MCDHDIQTNFDIKVLSLIDVSSEDDRLISSPICDQITPRFSGSFDEYGKLEENQSRRKRRSNLRKSLTCDSSFFSSAAFLEPEEFCSMMTGNEEGEIRTLPGIQEDVNKSCDASTMLDSLEDDSVEPASYNVKREPETTDPRTVSCKNILNLTMPLLPFSASKKLESTNKDKVMHKGAPKKPNITMKQVSFRPSSQSVGRSGISTSSLHKPPKGVSRVGVKDVKMEKDAKNVTAEGKSRAGRSLAESENRVPNASTRLLNPVPIKPSGLRPPSPKRAFSNGVRVTRHTRNRSMPSLPSAPIDFPIIGARSTNPSGGLNKAHLRNDSRNPKISTGITPKVQNKPSPRIGRESYSKDPGIGSAEKKLGSEQPKLVVKLGGKEGARIKDI